jgi:integrase
VLAVYPAVAVPAYQRESVARVNGNALRLVLREVGESLALPVDRLDGSVWTRFEHGRLARVPEAERAARKSAMETVNSYARAARSIFQARLVALYRAKHGLHLPEAGPGTALHGFLTAPLAQPRREKKRKPPRELVQRTFEAAEVLRGREPAVYAAWLLAAYSLRAAEVMRAEREWIREEEMEDDFDFTVAGVKQWVIRTDLGKSDRSRQIPIPEGVAQWLIEFYESEQRVRPTEGRWLIPRSVKFAGMVVFPDSVVRRARAWMRSLGWTTPKLLHEMRALFLRRVRARHGLDAARELGGHQDERTTENNYTGGKSLRDVVIPLPMSSAK